MPVGEFFELGVRRDQRISSQVRSNTQNYPM